jgi:Tail tubular protein
VPSLFFLGDLLMAITPLNFTPQTELDAVNQMLLSIGQSPVNTLTVTGLKDVSFARLMLHNTSREVQTKGWYFNTDTDFPLAADVDGKVTLPANSLACDPTDGSLNLVERYEVTDTSTERRFWDLDEHTFVINKTIKVDVTWFFPFEQLPQAARAHIAHKAGRIFQAAAVGSQILYQYTKERELETLAELERVDLQSDDTNVFKQNSSTNNIFFRR